MIPLKKKEAFTSELNMKLELVFIIVLYTGRNFTGRSF